jgi:hypothetical protein
MKPADSLKKLIKERRYEADAETYDKALGSFLQAVDEHLEQKSVPSEPKIWRRIVKSRITKLAAAAAIIIGAYVVVHLSGGSIDVAGVTLAQIRENMRAMPWLHAVVEAKQAAGTEMVDIRCEFWICFERQLSAAKDSNGKVIFQNELEHIFQGYDPNTETITILGKKGLNWNKNLSSVGDIPGAMIKAYEDAGEQVVRETGKYKGKDVLIFRMSAFLGGRDMWVEMAVDAKMQVVVFINQKAFDEDGKLTEEVNAHIDYPETGPETIYDVGVPRAAKIVSEEKIAYEEEIWKSGDIYEQAVVKPVLSLSKGRSRDSIARYNRSFEPHRLISHSLPTLRIFRPRFLPRLRYTSRGPSARTARGHCSVPAGEKQGITASRAVIPVKCIS